MFFQFDLPRMPDLLMEKYQSIGATYLKQIETSLKEDAKLENALKAIQGLRTTPSGGAATTTSPTPSRTHGSPDWNGEVPVNFRKRLQIDAITVSEFEANNTCFGYILPIKYIRVLLSTTPFVKQDPKKETIIFIACPFNT